MRVGFLGNVNNHPFIVAKHLRDRGAEALFYVEAAPDNSLYRPESTGLVSYPYPGWILESRKLQRAHTIHFPNLFASDVLRELNNCDAVITNDYGHRFIPYLKPRLIKICMFTGGDLEIMADYQNVYRMKLASKKLAWLPRFLKKRYAHYSVDQLRNGIRRADLLGYYPEGLNPLGDRLLKEILEGQPIERYSHWCVMLDGLEYTPAPANKKVRIFNVCRFMWKKPFPPGTMEYEDKGNDIMIRALGEFLSRHPGLLDIHFVEKGINVQETKELILECGIESSVTWHREMPVSMLFEEIRKSDIVFDQLGTHLIGAGIYAMAIGRPLIANARPEIMQKITRYDIPICHATNVREVVNWLEKLVFDARARNEIGKRSSHFAFQNMNIANESEYYFNYIHERLTERKRILRREIKEV